VALVGVDEATGVLVNPGDAEAMACAIERLLEDESLRCRLAENAANDAQQRFDLKREVMEYLDWYREVVEDNVARRMSSEPHHVALSTK
jgi:glycosyltransferase involved in cell wall biosynthesis